jgi:hypothetical protein
LLLFSSEVPDVDIGQQNTGSAMKSYAIRLGFLALFLVFGFYGAPAQAQATRTWVSGVGSDGNPCSRTAPCLTFAGAIASTAAGGEINCLDPGGFGSLTITKAISIICESGEAGVLVSGTNAFNVAAGATDVVFLKGLDFEGTGTGLIGINFTSGAALHVENCIIHGFNAGSALGILFAPTAAGSRLFVTDSYISENGVGSTGGGIFVRPNGGSATALAELNRVSTNNNATGTRADGTGNGGVKLSVRDSNSSGNTFGGYVSFSPSGGPAVTVLVDSATVSNNGGNGLNANGATAALQVSRSVITGNGVSVATPNGGVLQSYGDNDIFGNTTNTLPTTISHN